MGNLFHKLTGHGEERVPVPRVDELEVLYQYYFSVYHAVSDRPDPAYKLVWQDAFKKMEDLRR